MILIVGTYRKFGKIKKLLIFFFKSEFLENYYRNILFRKDKPITIFYSRENERKRQRYCFSAGTDFN